MQQPEPAQLAMPSQTPPAGTATQPLAADPLLSQPMPAQLVLPGAPLGESQTQAAPANDAEPMPVIPIAQGLGALVAVLAVTSAGTRRGRRWLVEQWRHYLEVVRHGLDLLRLS